MLQMLTKVLKWSSVRIVKIRENTNINTYTLMVQKFYLYFDLKHVEFFSAYTLLAIIAKFNLATSNISHILSRRDNSLH